MNYNPYSDYGIITNELLEYNRPVILSGESTPVSLGRQYWICDGVHQFEDLVPGNDGEMHIACYLYFHHSWMLFTHFPPVWLGFNNYNIQAFSSQSVSFDNNMKLVYNIIP